MNFEQALLASETSEFKEDAELITAWYILFKESFNKFQKKYPLDINVYWGLVENGDVTIVPMRDTNLESYY